jgi:hypothetical protein
MSSKNLKKTVKTWPARKRFARGAATVAGLFAIALLSACEGSNATGNGTGQGSLRPRPGDTGEGGKTDPLPQKPVEPSASCASPGSSRFCIGVKAVAYKSSSGSAVIDSTATQALIDRVNVLWSACDIAFQVDEYAAVDPREQGLSYGSQSQNETTAIRGTYSDDSTFLIAFTGPWSTSTIAWTEMPGGAPYGAIISADFARHEVAVGHELGHYIGLDHYSSSSNLLSPVVYSTARGLTASQCESARDTILYYWGKMLR